MKILFVTHRLPYAPNRGDRIRAYHMLQHLGREASVSLLSLVHDREEEAADLSSLPITHATLVRTTPWRNRMRSAMALPTRQPLTHTLLDSPGLEAALAEAVALQPPDVVLAFCTGVARLAFSEPLKNVPVVLDMVDVDSAKWSALSASTRPPMRWIYGREARCLGAFERSIVARCATTLVVTDRERTTLREEVGAGDIRVIPNGVDLQQFHNPHVPTAAPRVVFCGVMNYAPNEAAALRLARGIWPKIRAVRPDARLTFVGAHPTAAVRDLAVADGSIEVTGAVADVRPYLWKAAVSAAPIHTARGVQNKVLEALAAGLPVVTSEVVASGLPASVLPGCLVAERDEDAADAIVWLLAQDPLARRAVANQADLSRLGWDEQMAPLRGILSAAARRRPCIRLAS